MINKSPQYVSQTPAGKVISAWCVIRTGRHAGDVAAKVSAHYSGSRVLVNVEDVAGFRSATGQDLEEALSYLEIDGVQMYGHAKIPDDAAKWLKKAAAIYQKNPLPVLPDLGLEQGAMKWPEYMAELNKRITPEYRAAQKARGEVKDKRIALMNKLTAQAEARGMQFCNGGEDGPKSIYYISGLARLAYFNMKISHII